MKMTELFPEAFQVEGNESFEVQNISWFSYGDEYQSTAEQDSAIEHAVMNHDRLEQENAELKGLNAAYRLAYDLEKLTDEELQIFKDENKETIEKLFKLLNK